MTPAPERRVVEALRRRGLDLPARVLLDAHRPLGPLAADLSAALAPWLGAFGSSLADDDPISRLLGALDEPEERDARTG